MQAPKWKPFKKEYLAKLEFQAISENLNSIPILEYVLLHYPELIRKGEYLNTKNTELSVAQTNLGTAQSNLNTAQINLDISVAAVANPVRIAAKLSRNP